MGGMLQLILGLLSSTVQKVQYLKNSRSHQCRVFDGLSALKYCLALPYSSSSSDSLMCVAAKVDVCGDDDSGDGGGGLVVLVAVLLSIGTVVSVLVTVLGTVEVAVMVLVTVLVVATQVVVIAWPLMCLWTSSTPSLP